MIENKIENQTSDGMRKYLDKHIIDETMQETLLENGMSVDGREVPA